MPMHAPLPRPPLAPPPRRPVQCPRLKGIQSMGAGVDSLIGEPSLPRHVPLLRVIDPLMSQRMAMWVLWGVLNVQVGRGRAGRGRGARVAGPLRGVCVCVCMCVRWGAMCPTGPCRPRSPASPPP